jgi:hypothetical protein
MFLIYSKISFYQRIVGKKYSNCVVRRRQRKQCAHQARRKKSKQSTNGQGWPFLRVLYKQSRRATECFCWRKKRQVLSAAKQKSLRERGQDSARSYLENLENLNFC